MKKLLIPNKTNQNIAIAIHEPQESNNKLVILCPGFLDSKDYWHLVGLAERMSEEGYTAVRFDPIGTWASEGEMSDYTPENYLDSIRIVKGYMKSQDNYESILIGGHSRGGRMSIIYAAQDPEIQAVIDIMGSTGSRKMDVPDPKPKFHIQYRNIPNSPQEKKEINVPYDIFLTGKSYASTDSIKNLSVPLLVIAGELDKIVPLTEMQKVYDQACEPKEYIVMKGVGHDYRHNRNEIKMINDVVVNWLKNQTI